MNFRDDDHVIEYMAWLHYRNLISREGREAAEVFVRSICSHSGEEPEGLLERLAGFEPPEEQSK